MRNYIGSQVHFNEYTRGTRPINAKNIKERSETILDQYGKTGSLYPHNVVLVPLGDDFMYYEVIWIKYENGCYVIIYIYKMEISIMSEMRYIHQMIFSFRNQCGTLNINIIKR